MAGRGPTPKHPSRRRRQNRVDSTMLPAEGRTAPYPPLGDGYRSRVTDANGDPTIVPFLPETVDWYDTLCKSPEAACFSDVDLSYLRTIVALLYDKFQRRPTKDLAAELRLQLTQFGCTPDAKKRLGWEIDEGAEGQAEGSVKVRRLRAVDPRQDDRERER